MLDLAGVKEGDLVYDLGSGDGRILITAAKKYGCRAVGYEIDKTLAELSREKAREAGVEELVTIHTDDLFKADLSAADVVAVYLLPKQLEALLPQLKEQLKPSARVVSHHFQLPGVLPDKSVRLPSADGEPHTVYLWTSPLQAIEQP